MSPGSHRRTVRLIPFFRNARVPFLPVTTATALRALLVAIVVMAAVVAWALWELYDLSDSGRTTLAKVTQQQRDGRQARLDFQREIQQQQAYTQTQVRGLACSVVAFTPPERSNRFIRSLAVTYHCPAYRPTATASPALDGGTSSASAPTPAPASRPTPDPTPRASSPAVPSPTVSATPHSPSSQSSPSMTGPACLPVLGCLP